VFFFIKSCSMIKIYEYFRANFCFQWKDRHYCENLKSQKKKKEKRKCCYQTEVHKKCLFASGFEMMFIFVMNKKIG